MLLNDVSKADRRLCALIVRVEERELLQVHCIAFVGRISFYQLRYIMSTISHDSLTQSLTHSYDAVVDVV